MQRSTWMRAAAVLAVAWTFAGAAGPSRGTAPGPDGGALAPGAVPALDPGGRRLLLVMVDGLPVRLFESALAQGLLPRLQTLMASRPTVRTTALATFPSATAPSLPEALSGAFVELPHPTAPGAVHAFDREQRRVVRYITRPRSFQWPVPDLFTAAAAAGLPALTVAEGRWDGAQAILTRGAMLRDATLEILGVEGFNGDRRPVKKLIRRLTGPSPPVVTLLVFNSVDLNGHFHGPDSGEARKALVETDQLLGDVLDALGRVRGPAGRTLFEDTTVILFGDHGMVPSAAFVHLRPFFKRHGLSSFDVSTRTQVLLREPLGPVWTRWPDVLLVPGGSNVTQIYLRQTSGAWTAGGPDQPRKAVKVLHRPSPAALAAELARLPGISQVIRVLEDGRVELRGAGETVGWVTRDGSGRSQRFAYSVPAGAESDPLDYLAEAALAPRVCRGEEPTERCFLGRDEWLDLSASARFPGAVALLHKALHPERFTGDLVATTLPGFTFFKGEKGDHGNLEREAMLTPFLLNGPGVDPRSEMPAVRLVDLYPTAAVLLGADPADPALAGLDGRPLPCVRPPEWATEAAGPPAGTTSPDPPGNAGAAPAGPATSGSPSRRD